MPLFKFTKIERRRISLFFLCLILAVGAWLFFSLSDKYVYQVQTLVRFVNLPENRAFNPLQSDTLRLQVEGTGWQLLFSKLRINPQSVDIELKDLKKQNFIELSSQIQKINIQIGSIQKVVYVNPDTLYFDFSSSTVKKIPVVFKQNVKFKSQFGISDSVQINPAFITITGPVKELSEVNYWETEVSNLTNLSESLNLRINLKRPVKANVTIYPNYVNVKLNIDEFTEKVIEIPVGLINNKEFRNVKLLPDKVKLTILSPLSKYPEIERKDFELYVDLDNWKKDGYSQLPVRIIRLPEFSKLVKIEPQTLDFIIQK
jgi:hypothetical protein